MRPAVLDLAAPAFSGPGAGLHLGPVVLLRPAGGLAVRARSPPISPGPARAGRA